MEVSNFSKLMASGDLARTNLYSVRFGFIQSQKEFYTKTGREYDPYQLSHMARNVTLPGKSLATIDVKRFGAQFKLANDLMVDSISMTIMCNEDMRERLFFEGWINSIYGHTINQYETTSRLQGNKHKMYRVKYYNDYVTSIWLSTESRNTGKSTYEVELDEAYPTQIGPVEMSAGSEGEIATFTVTFTMRDWHAVTNDNVINPDAYKKSNEGEREGQEYYKWTQHEVEWDKERAEEMEMERLFDAADWANDKQDDLIALDYQADSRALAKELIIEHKETRSRHFSDIILPGDFYRDENGRYLRHEDGVDNSTQAFNYNAMLVQQKIYQVASKVDTDSDNFAASKAASDALKIMQDITVATQNGVEYDPDKFIAKNMRGFRSVNKGILNSDNNRAMVVLSEETFGRETLNELVPANENSSITLSKTAVDSGVEFDKRSYSLQAVGLGREILKNNANKLDLETPPKETTDNTAYAIEAHKIDHYKKESFDNATADVSWYEAQKTSDMQDNQIQQEYAKEADAEADIAINNASDIQIEMEKKYDENARKVQLDHSRDSQIMAHGFKSGDAQKMSQGFIEADAQGMAQDFISADLEAAAKNRYNQAVNEATSGMEDVPASVFDDFRNSEEYTHGTAGQNYKEMMDIGDKEVMNIGDFKNQKIVDLKTELDTIERYFNKGDNESHEWDDIWGLQMSDEGEFVMPEQEIMEMNDEGESISTGRTNYDVFIDDIYDRSNEIKESILEMESETVAPIANLTYPGGNDIEFIGGFPSQGEMFYKDTKTEEHYMTKDNVHD